LYAPHPYRPPFSHAPWHTPAPPLHLAPPLHAHPRQACRPATFCAPGWLSRLRRGAPSLEYLALYDALPAPPATPEPLRVGSCVEAR
jgi:hypothetical protein